MVLADQLDKWIIKKMVQKQHFLKIVFSIIYINKNIKVKGLKHFRQSLGKSKYKNCFQSEQN